MPFFLITTQNIAHAETESNGEKISKVIEDQTGTKQIQDTSYNGKANGEVSNNTDNKIVIPNNPQNNDIKVQDYDNNKDSLSVELPKKSIVNTYLTKSDNGTIVYSSPNVNDSNIAVQPIDDGFKSLIQINNADAPKEYAFKFNLSKGYKLISAKDYLGNDYDTKEVFIVNDNNEIISIIDPAWAKDANGHSIDTYYKIEGNTLIQRVNFNSNSIFPIVADPDWWKISRCAASIAWALGSAAISYVKILKIKRYIKELKGLGNAITKLIKAHRSRSAMLHTGGTALLGLASTILGINDIRDNCF